MSKRLRYYKVVGGSIEDAEGCGDGAYELLDLTMPDVIATTLVDSLREVDLWSQCEGGTFEDRGQPLYLSLRIKISAAPIGEDEE